MALLRWISVAWCWTSVPMKAACSRSSDARSCRAFGVHLTGRTDPGQLNGAVVERKSKSVTQIFGGRCNAFVLGFDDRSALPTDRESPGMRMIRMFAGDEGFGGLQTMHQTMLNQEIQAPIHTRRRDRREPNQCIDSTQRCLIRSASDEAEVPRWVSLCGRATRPGQRSSDSG